jgi:hypothetical protein
MTGIALVRSARQAKPITGPSQEYVGANSNDWEARSVIPYIDLL